MKACMKKVWKVSVFLLILLGLTLSFGGCIQETADEDDTTDAAAVPVITAQPTSIIGGSGTFTVTATSPDNGALSYQWYTNTANSGSGGTPVSGETTNSYTVSGIAATTWYYVVVNNHNDAAVGNKDSTITSVPVAALIPNATVTVNTAAKFQYVRGFGGMLGSWNTDPGQDVSVRDIETMYNPDTGLGYNILRMMVYPYGMEEWEDQIIGNVAYPNHDNSDWYDIIKKVNGYKGYILASPWSPLAAWKTNNTINGGGTLKTNFYHDYALHLKNYAKLMSDRGAPIYAISIQNEPNFIATYDGCEWSADEMKNFFVQEGHFTDGVPGYGGGEAISSVKTMNGETANNININDTALNDATSRAAIDLIGRHIYGASGGEYTLAKTHNKEVWMTEHNINGGNATSYPNDSTWNYVWKFMNEVDFTIRLNNENAFIWWYAKRFYSMIGDGDYGTTNHAILPRGYGLSHYAKFAKETNRVDVAVSGTTATGSALTIGSNVNVAVWGGTNGGQDDTTAKITAYESPDGNSISLVMFTPTAPSGANGVNLGSVTIQLPAGFRAASAVAMRSNASVKAQTENVALSADGNQAAVSLSDNEILSVRFTR